MALSPTMSLTVRGIILASSRNYCVLSNQRFGLGCLQQNNLPFKIQKAQIYSDKNQPKPGSLHYFRYHLRHARGSEGVAKSRSWEYKLSKFLFSLPGIIVLLIVYGVYQKRNKDNQQSHWAIIFIVERFKRIKKFLLE